VANYLLQADPGGACCDCPSRASPCDTCASCGGASCHLPVQTCPHAVCFKVAIDQQEIDAGGASGEFFHFNFASNNFIGFWHDYGTHLWTLFLYTAGTSLTLSQTIVAGQYYCVKVSIWASGTTPPIAIKFSVDGIDSSTANVNFTGGSDLITKALFGAWAAAASNHHSIKEITVLANPNLVCTPPNPNRTESDFIFPTNSFTSITAGITFIDGGGTLRVDSAAFVNAYGSKTLDSSDGAGYDINCQC
jgi:hypothetical protein